jgi:hypothetical protein
LKTTSSTWQLWQRRLCWGVALFIMSLVIVAVGFYLAMTTSPASYEQLVQATALVPPPQLAIQADDAEREILAVQQQVRRTETWEVVLEQQQINAWLALHIEQEFAALLPAEFSQPRIRIVQEQMEIAAVYSGKVKGVVTMQLEPYLTTNSNEIAIRIKSLKLGYIALPLHDIMQQISQTAAQENIPLTWGNEEGHPLALVQLPHKQKAFPGRKWELKLLQLADEKIILQGTAEKL